MGRSGAVPLDYNTLMRDIRAQGLKHALERQPLRSGPARSGSYSNVNEGKALKKVMTKREMEDEVDEPQQPRSAPFPFRRESPSHHGSDDAQLFAKLTAEGLLTSPPRQRALSPPLGVASLKSPDENGRKKKGGARGSSEEAEDELVARASFLPSRMTDHTGPASISGKIPTPSKPPRLPPNSSLRHSQSPQKRSAATDSGKQRDANGVEKESKSVRISEDANSSRLARPKAEQSSADKGNVKPSEGGASLRGDPRLRAEGLMAPPAADAASLRRQVAALQVELEAHIEGEGKLQSVNAQLRERLEAFQAQNHESMARADEELGALHKDLDRTLELQNTLADRASSLEREKHYIEAALQKRVAEFEAERTVLKARIEDMSEDVRVKAEATAQAELLKVELDSVLAVRDSLENEVERLSAESMYVKQKAEEYSKELRALLEKEEREDLLHRRWRKALQNRMFAHFCSAVATQKSRRRHKRAAEKFAARRTLSLGFHSWALAATRSKRIEHLISKRQLFLLQEVCRVWRLELSVGSRQRTRERARRRMTLGHVLAKWREWIRATRAVRARFESAENFCNFSTCRRALRAWKGEVGKAKLSLQEEDLLGLGADSHYERALRRRALWAWMDWVDDVAKPRAARISRAAAQNRRSLLRRAFRGWEDGVDARSLRAERKKTAVEMANQSLTQRGFEAWCQYRQHKVETRGRQALADKCLLEHRFKVWHSALLDIRDEREARKKGSRLRITILRKTCMRAWVHVVVRKKRARAANTRAFAHYLGALRLSAWVAWREGVGVLRAERKAILEGQHAVLRSALARWKDYQRHCHVKKGLEARACAHARRVAARALRKVVQEWWEVRLLHKQHLRFEALMKERSEKALIRRCFVSWRLAVYEGLRDVHFTVHNEYVESQAKCEEQAARISAVDLENLQLIDRLHALSTEFGQLQGVIKEQRDKNDDLQKSLEESAVLESSLRADADHQRARARALQDEIAGLQRALHGRNEEDTAVEVRHQLELQGLRKEKEELKKELEEKSAQLEACEHALKDASDQLDSSAAHSQEKLNSALAIAASLRQLLEEKEGHVAALEAERQAAELDLGEAQRKVAAANQTLRDAVDAREGRIRELEQQARQHQQEAQRHQLETQEMRIAVERRSAQVRKLEYEVKLLRDREQNKADAFISALHARARSPPGAHAPQPPPSNVNKPRSEWQGALLQPTRAEEGASSHGDPSLVEGATRVQISSPERPQQPTAGPSSVSPDRRPLPYAFATQSRADVAAGESFLTSEKRHVAGSEPPADTPEKHLVSSEETQRRSPGVSFLPREQAVERGLSSQRPIYTEPKRETFKTPVTSPQRNALPDSGRSASPEYRRRPTVERPQNPQTLSGQHVAASGAQHAGFARWTPPTARDQASNDGPFISNGKSSELRRGQGVQIKERASEGQTSGERSAEREAERRGSSSPGSDDSARDLHSEIQKLQARIMDRLKETPAKGDLLSSQPRL